MASSHGYLYEFVDSVSDDLFCRQCTLVARTLSITTCCGESFCHACLSDAQEQGKACPECGEKDYNIVGHVKSQRRIKCLQVYCSMKERGCDWSGMLEQLDTHLDPDQNKCEHVDTSCPLNCHQIIPRNKVEEHVAQDCVKRQYICKHCSFKATYEEVVDKHLTECKYVALDCPNLCGVTFERDFMEDHMKMCRLQEVMCEFSGVGCDDRFNREDQDEHVIQNSQKHLTLTASLAVETKEKFQKKLLEEDKKHKEEETKLNQKIEELERKLISQRKQHSELEKTLKQEQETKLNELKEFLEQQFNFKLQVMEQELQSLTKKSVKNESNLSNVSSMMVVLNRKFEMKNFSAEKAKSKINDWYSPAMYTHVCGYKFCVGVCANGYGLGIGNSLYVAVWSMPGEYDDQLKWPIHGRFCVELINQQGGENLIFSKKCGWSKPSKTYEFLCCFYRTNFGLLEHSEVRNYLDDDNLYFHVSDVQLL